MTNPAMPQHYMSVTADGWPSCTCGSKFATWHDAEGHCNYYQTMDAFTVAVGSLVRARAQVRKWESEVTRLRELLIELKEEQR